MSTSPLPTGTPLAPNTTAAPVATTTIAPTSGLITVVRVVILLVVAGLLFDFYSKGINYLAARDQNAANKAVATLQAQSDANQKAALASRQTAAQYQQLAQQLIANNKAISLAQQQLAATTQKLQTIDQTLPPPELATRWTSLVQVAPATVQPSSSGYQVTQDTAVKTVTQLEIIPDLQAEVAGNKTIIANDESQIGKQSSVVTDLQSQIIGLNVQIADASTVNAKQIAAIKSKTRVSKLKWFFIGFASGFVAREIIKP